MSKKKEPTYSITPKGLINLETDDLSLTDAIMDSLELHALRTNCNAILIDNKGWTFIKVEELNEKI